MNVAPGATYEAVVTWGTTGATLGMRVIDNAGSTTVSRVTGFTEYPAGSGIYARTGNTAPSTAGDYTLVFDDDGGTAAVGHVATDELTVTYTAVSTSTGSIYATPTELKAALQLTSQTYADGDITRACAAASRAIDNKTGRFYYSASETRYYTPDRFDNALDIIDIQSVSSLTIDTAGNNTFSTSWTEHTDYDLEPFNAAAVGKPFERVRLRSNAGRIWPNYQRSVKVIGTFGWASVPDPVNQYAIILASKLLKRTREAPFGVLSFGLDEPTAIRIARNDPDFELLLGNYVKTTPGA